MYQLGVPKTWNIVDVYGLDEDILEFVPKPVKSVILLFPCSEAVSIDQIIYLFMYIKNTGKATFFHNVKFVIFINKIFLNQYEKHRSEEDAALQDNPPETPSDVFYMKQIIHNACGTIALVHAIANSDIELEAGVLKSYLDKAKNLSVEERGKLLEGKIILIKYINSYN